MRTMTNGLCRGDEYVDSSLKANELLVLNAECYAHKEWYVCANISRTE